MPKLPWGTKDYMAECRIFYGNKNLVVVRAYLIINTDDEYILKV